MLNFWLKRLLRIVLHHIYKIACIKPDCSLWLNFWLLQSKQVHHRIPRTLQRKLSITAHLHRSFRSFLFERQWTTPHIFKNTQDRIFHVVFLPSELLIVELALLFVIYDIGYNWSEFVLASLKQIIFIIHTHRP